ncbi:hypothetical protein CTA2_2454 [Colletotrichum tanaceti]|uniref:Uncharacterized protein n=1 Tax=Colletotrichum tanaceti TaxID=1306861 RepID=A0A4U6X3W3_9PEZI|nr:hypothetical protein CTA2_2454 [Colletotrichum tanaceti]TKW49855.1 hypothetical protein CTA1_1154 [Colletotrichum tanaceti]
MLIKRSREETRRGTKTCRRHGDADAAKGREPHVVDDLVDRVALGQQRLDELVATGAQRALLEVGLAADDAGDGGRDAEAQAAPGGHLGDERARRVDDDPDALRRPAPPVPRLGRVVVVDAPDADVEQVAVEVRGAEGAVRVLVGAHVHVEEVGEQLGVERDGHVADEVHLAEALPQPERLLVEEPRADAPDELVDRVVQVRHLAERPGHVDAVLDVLGLVAREHEPADVPLGLRAEQGLEGLQPRHDELLGAAEHLLDGRARHEHDGAGRRLRVVRRVQVEGAELPGDGLVRLAGVHGLHDGDGVVREPVGEAALDELVQHRAPEGLVVLPHLVEPPRRQVRDGVVDGVEPVGAHERDGVRQHGPADRVRRTDAAARVPGRLDVLDHEAGVELDHVGVGVQLLEEARDVRVRVDLAELVVLLEPEEAPELVETGDLPLARLVDAEDLDDLEGLWDHAGAEAAGGIVHGLLEDPREVPVPKGTVRLALEAVKGADARVPGDALLKGHEGPAELGHADVLQVLGPAVREQLGEEAVDPALVLLGDARVEAVQQVELDADLVPDAARHALAVELLADLDAGVERPVALGVVRVGDGPQVVVEADVDVQPAHDQPRRVEEVVVLLGRRLGPVFGAGVGGTRQREAAVLVDLEQHVADVVVEPAVEHQHDVDARRLSEETLLVERVGLETALLHGADLQLVLQGRAVEGRQVEVRRGVGLVHVGAVGPEDVVDDDGRVVEEHGRDAGRVLLERAVVTSHQEIEEQSRVGLDAVERLDAPHRLGVRRARPAQVGLEDVVEAPVRHPVVVKPVGCLRDLLAENNVAVRGLELDRVLRLGLAVLGARLLGVDNVELDVAADIAQRRVLEGIPEGIDEFVGELRPGLRCGGERRQDPDQDLGRSKYGQRKSFAHM